MGIHTIEKEPPMTPERVLEGLDSAEERLDSLEEVGRNAFAWAWENIAKELFDRIEQLDTPNNAKISDQLAAITKKHREVRVLWDTLNDRVYESSMDAEVITSHELKKAIDGYKQLFDQLRAVLETKETVANADDRATKNRSDISKTLASKQ